MAEKRKKKFHCKFAVLDGYYQEKIQNLVTELSKETYVPKKILEEADKPYRFTYIGACFSKID